MHDFCGCVDPRYPKAADMRACGVLESNYYFFYRIAVTSTIILYIVQASVRSSSCWPKETPPLGSTAFAHLHACKISFFKWHCVFIQGVRNNCLDGTLWKAKYTRWATCKDQNTRCSLLKVIGCTDFDAVCCVWKEKLNSFLSKFREKWLTIRVFIYSQT